MHADLAREQLEVIHEQIARVGEFRGFRPGYLAAIGGAAGALGVVQFVINASGTAGHSTLLWQWIALALVAGGLVFAFALLPELTAASRYRRELAASIVRQFLPPLFLGFVVAIVALAGQRSGLVPYLPALLTGVFGLGIGAISPFVPARARHILWWYLCCSMVLFAYPVNTASAVPVAMSVPFAVGHLLTSVLMRKS